ncbi:hypothetical protein DFW101_3521 [Solidesulfovibrio carbinoliphilus subsp. oakridgensis]|uniref:Uncharacterized protein n=1 Tax=Solidesulfovibrio carbinoliphilus subsp. oakridgensis TaxID=694327 RepID=G7QC71_9BACT|nr:hypothetical protein [Solidesulfovibrio carbinoliphilus]EHJ49517.1 hypothetical protein DFW101_3521 [Solidesulfovibrio carbinoliphilus subsp. oakridgensis]
MQDTIKSAIAQFKRLAIANFWDRRAAFLEVKAVTMFREAGTARENARQALQLPDDGAAKVFDVLIGGSGVKTVVKPEGGEGVVN